MIERWEYIQGTDSEYMISNTGDVKSMERYANVCGGGKRLVKSRILKKCMCKGYYVARLGRKHRVGNSQIHRLVANAFIPNPENKPQVNHIDGDKLNNNADNLEWCTAAENLKHARDTGLNNSIGEKHGRSKLSEEDVICIRHIANKNKLSNSQIAHIFDCSSGMIHSIVTRKNWKHI